MRVCVNVRDLTDSKYAHGPNIKLVVNGKLILNKRDNYMTFMTLRFNFGILIFGLGTKATILYFHFNPCATSYIVISCS